MNCSLDGEAYEWGYRSGCGDLRKLISSSPHALRMVSDAVGIDGLVDDWLALPQTTLELNIELIRM